MNQYKGLTRFASYLISHFDQDVTKTNDKTISVNPVVSEVATWYEKIRNVMDYREEDVILRAAIERIIKRRMILGGSGRTVAEPLVRELVWARYFPDSTVPESIVEKVEATIDLYFNLQNKVLSKHRVSSGRVYEWIIQLMSSEIEDILSPSRDKETLSNFIFQVYKDKVSITDDSEEVKDAQVFIAIRRTFDKEDLALLRYHLFIQLFDKLNLENVNQIAQDFVKGIKKIEDHLNYPLKDRIYTYIKRQTIPFFILEDILKSNRGSNRQLINNEDQFRLAVLNSCNQKYENIKAKVGRAVIRGAIFILITKTIFALAVEGSFESLVYGSINWFSISLNTAAPPILMIIVGFMIKTPGKENSVKISEKLNQALFEPSQDVNDNLVIRKTPKKTDPILNIIFVLLWLLALSLSFGSVVFLLTGLGFTLISQVVFIFFLAIVSFISYRISQTAHMFTVSEEKQNLKSVFFDFFFMPFIHIGRDLTENISKLNLFLFIFDMIIETPFKVIFGFFEQWFLYLRTQREKLG